MEAVEAAVVGAEVVACERGEVDDQLDPGSWWEGWERDLGVEGVVRGGPEGGGEDEPVPCEVAGAADREVDHAGARGGNHHLDHEVPSRRDGRRTCDCACGMCTGTETMPGFKPWRLSTGDSRP